MTVTKITSPITPLELIDKTNEIIDNLGGGGGSAPVWGGITGTLADQTDLKTALDGKQDTITSSNKLPASLVSGLATVATSGSYNDLTNKPTIPTVVSTVSASSTNADALGAKLFYDTCGDIETLINAL